MLVQKARQRNSLSFVEVFIITTILDALIIFMSSFWLLFVQIAFQFRKGLSLVVRQRLLSMQMFGKIHLFWLQGEPEEQILNKTKNWVEAATYQQPGAKSKRPVVDLSQTLYRISKSTDTSELLEEIVEVTKLLEESSEIASQILVVNAVKYFSDPEKFDRWLNVLTQMRKRSTDISLTYFHPNLRGSCWTCSKLIHDGNSFCGHSAPPYPVVQLSKRL
eukprot:TRINITY_DN3322_c0_g1_i1.p1 TRINITY_DN3322_c0_g1~~TRINITY_DN3322_c0_g1_i1.p1  ORF type:complete len:219 (-),score=35.64 TRINITY_DN3322_c0_g1_i1:89-745(-)